jgi:hypothetical protein
VYVAPIRVWVVPLGKVSNWSHRTGVDILHCPLPFDRKLLQPRSLSKRKVAERILVEMIIQNDGVAGNGGPAPDALRKQAL